MAVIAAQRAAQARLGLVAAYLVLLEWESVHATNPADTAGKWMEITLRIIFALRLLSRRMAIAGYQLVRALDAGSTYGALLDEPQVKQPTLGQLREQFGRELDAIAKIDKAPGYWDDPDVQWVEEVLQGVDPGKDTNARSQIFQATDLDPYIKNLRKNKRANDDQTRIDIDPFTWPRPMTKPEVDREYRALLNSSATQSQADFVERIKEDEMLSASKALDLIAEHHDRAGSNGAGTADQAVVDGGRFALFQAMKRDKKIKLVARGTGPHPCSFCAMLASRGFVYTSLESAVGVTGEGGDVTKYHRNCHCYPIIRYVDAKDAQLPRLSEFFADQWERQIAKEGYSGAEARRVWRRWLERTYRENPEIIPSPFA